MTISTTEDNIIGGADRFRHILHDLFCHLAKHMESSAALNSTKWLAASAETSANGDDAMTPLQTAVKSEDTAVAKLDNRIAVVEPEDADLL